MKTKKITTKLTFTKKTIANLDTHELNNIQAGISGEVCVIRSIETFCLSCICVYTVTKCFTQYGPGGLGC